ncbi:hypothetical protein K440DRAFT_535277 [Wilcoxina mikolae CBS 423.85]|nr:hypothetical protein K440DRAFT_535277 [Wilcoxina mikolae CBS 423.85]
MDLPHKFSWFEYLVFVVLGVAMLWSWNMFMACATYFQGRFAQNEIILNNFQSMILGVSTLTNLGVMVYLSNHQSSANYPYRICISLVLNCITFTLLAFSTVVFYVTSTPYLVFTLSTVLVAALSCGFSQNGVFAFVNTFGGIYTQAIMTGQGIAGVLPAIAQIVSVLAVSQSTSEQSGKSSQKSAFAYFLTATFVSGLGLALFLALLSRYGKSINLKTESHMGSVPDTEAHVPPRCTVSLLVLCRKLIYPSSAIWLSFCLTMIFPVFTQAITSVRPSGVGRAFRPDVFIPTAFLLWNIGDLSGRIACAWDAVTIKSPRLLVLLSIARAVFIPLYLMCNVGGHGAVIESDGFYWLVQLSFGFTNGWIGTSCMIVAPDFVDNEEKMICGGFMGLCLVLGLATGSIMSFFVPI